MIRSIAFHPKAMNDINNNGRSSDLFPFRFPSHSKRGTVDKARPKSVMKLTAVDLFRIYT